MSFNSVEVCVRFCTRPRIIGTRSATETATREFNLTTIVRAPNVVVGAKASRGAVPMARAESVWYYAFHLLQERGSMNIG
jgi:hypothetical protein